MRPSSSAPRILASAAAVVVSLASVMCVGEEPTGQPTEDASTGADASSPPKADTSTGADTSPSISDCEKRRSDESTGVFVSINGADSETCGTRLQPCQLVNTGIRRAALLKKANVHIARGTYPESITLLAGITLDGGWDPVGNDWKPVCGTDSLSATRFALAATESRVVVADFTGDAALRQLTIESKRAAKPGESVVGLFAVNAKIVLESVVVTMGAAGDGAVGAKGTAGAVGDTRCAAGNGAPGTDGAPGEAPLAGTFDASGFTPTNGAPGRLGSSGANGACGTNIACNTTCTALSPASVCSMGCGARPLSGCGGKPGTPGEGGMGGGSSIGIFGWSAKIVLKGGAYSVGNGGKGGAGGEGGAGGAGGATTSEQLLCVTCAGAGCATVGNQTLATGAVGGKGGAGGSGSGGSGGSSHAVYVGGPGATFTSEQNPTFTVGQAGTGGDGSPAGSAVAVVAPK